jgi:signal transduction histidine kinase
MREWAAANRPLVVGCFSGLAIAHNPNGQPAGVTILDHPAIRAITFVGSSPVVLADGVMLEQVILNIARNGIESMQQTAPDKRGLTMRSRVNQGGAIEVEIADTGCGIPAAMTGASFEPFFTTKPDGLGMGLNICRSILELHHGQLWATRNSGRGSTFHLTLPVMQT